MDVTLYWHRLHIIDMHPSEDDPSLRRLKRTNPLPSLPLPPGSDLSDAYDEMDDRGESEALHSPPPVRQRASGRTRGNLVAPAQMMVSSTRPVGADRDADGFRL